MIKKLFALSALILNISSFAAPAATKGTVPFSFSKNGKLIKKLSVAEMKKLVGEAKLTTVEPHDKVKVTYVGFDFPKLLTAIYGDSWKKMKKIKFTCSDGYNPLVAPEMFSKYSSYLVYAKEGVKDFNLKKDNEGGKIVDMSPYYLTWDTTKAPELDNVNNRPYQLVAIDVLVD